MMSSSSPYIFGQQANSQWQKRPLGRVGDLQGWHQRMKALCPNPRLGQVVWIENNHWDNGEGQYVHSSTGYKVINFRANGDPVWERGQVIILSTDDE